MPLFSIITVCKNSEKTISRTIESVLNQTYKDFEYIIIDGVSNDNTLNIIRSYKDSRIKVISEKDSGIYDAMNKGIKLSNGKIIGILNSDDYYEKDALYIIKENYNFDYQYQIIYGMLRIFYKNGTEKNTLINNINSIKEQSLLHPSTFISKRIYDEIKMYDLNYRSASDYDFFLSISKNKDIEFIKVERVVANFVEGGISSSFIGDYETYKIRKTYGIISRSKMNFLIVKSYIKHMLNI